jgi:hypothetical protein
MMRGWRFPAFLHSGEEVFVNGDLYRGWWRGLQAAWLAAGVLVFFGCAPAAPPAATVATTQAGHAGHDDDHDHEDDHDHDHDHDEHDDHDHPATVAGGLDELEEVCRKVKESLAAGDLEKADDAVHMAGHLVEDLQKLVADSKPDAAAGAVATAALDEIFDCFDSMDTALHSTDEEAARKLDYTAFAPRIEAAIETLRKSSR